MTQQGAGDEQVYAITSVRRALSEDVDDRAKRYLVSMAIRTICVVLACFIPSPWRWFAVALAVILPWLSVLVANAGRELPQQGSLSDPRAMVLPTSHSAPNRGGQHV